MTWSDPEQAATSPRSLLLNGGRYLGVLVRPAVGTYLNVALSLLRGCAGGCNARVGLALCTELCVRAVRATHVST